MSVSILDIFSIGIGPSSLHTLGPMRAANDFVEKLLVAKLLPKVTRVYIDLYGSLALAGKGAQNGCGDYSRFVRFFRRNHRNRKCCQSIKAS